MADSFWDDITPNFSDPGQMAVFGALGNVLQAGTDPRFAPNGNGITGGGKLNALAALTGAGLKGLNQGAAFSQDYKAENLANQNATLMNPLQQTGQNIANQTNALALQRQQALQPAQIAMTQDLMNGGGSTFGNIGNSSGGMSDADAKFGQAYKFALASGKLEEAGKVLQSWAEHSPQLAGAIEAAKANATATNSVNQGPNGPQVGTAGMPGSVPFSLSPPNPNALASEITNGVINQRPINVQGPGAQTAPNPIPTPSPASSFAGQPSGQPDPGILISDPVANSTLQNASTPKSYLAPKVNPMQKTSVEGAIKSTTEDASNLADAGKTYNVMQAQFPTFLQRIQDMTAANKTSSFGPIINDKEGNGIVPTVHDALNDKTSVSNAVLQQRASQGVLPEIGPALAQTGAKPNKMLEGLVNASTNLDLSKGQEARQAQIDGLGKAYVQNMISSSKQIEGLGGTPAPIPPQAIIQAIKYGIMTKQDAAAYLRQNHGMQ